jgi:uncharacterized DUF497 family protein
MYILKDAKDVQFLYCGQQFVWNAEKASANLLKHGVSFETACQVFFDPLVCLQDASDDDEKRDARSDWQRTGRFCSSSMCCARKT